jgi:ribosomal protein S18 acetylase RimI-like enzyme
MESGIRKASLQDIDGIVIIHQEAFKDFFLTSLGTRFLKLYYTSFVNCKDGVVFCAVKNNTIVGFSATSYVSHNFNSKLIKQNLFKYGLEALRLLFVRPKAVLRLIKNMNKESKSSTIMDNGLYAELYSIAVGPNYQGEGIGKRLLTVTEDDAREHNGEISLTTDYYDNDKTIGFYKALGYKEFYDFITYPDRRMWRMIKDLKK